jgi:hypothetical protein
MSIVRVGTTKKYSEGWDAIFGHKKGTARKPPASAKKAKKSASRKKKR